MANFAVNLKHKTSHAKSILASPPPHLRRPGYDAIPPPPALPHCRPPGAVEVEGVRRLVLPGVRPCSLFEEGVLHSWVGVLFAPPLGQG